MGELARRIKRHRCAHELEQTLRGIVFVRDYILDAGVPQPVEIHLQSDRIGTCNRNGNHLQIEYGKTPRHSVRIADGGFGGWR